MSTLPPAAERWLVELGHHLSPLPDAERAETVAELRSHLEERAAQGAPDLLAPFGEVGAYAALFLEQRALSGALASGTPLALGRALLGGARRLAWWYAVLALGLVQVLGGSLVVLAAVKLVLPGQVGLFVHGSAFTLGASLGGPPPEGVELLGWWAVPAFLLTGGLALWSSLAVLRALARWRLQRLQAQRAA